MYNRIRRVLLSLISVFFLISLANASTSQIDWDSIDTIAENKNLNLTELKIFDDETKIYMMIKGMDIADRSMIYIDSDNDSNTGYQISSWTQSGIEYLIYNERLYRSSSDTAWNWEYIQGINYEKSDSTVLIDFDKSLLIDLQDTFQLRITNFDDAWATKGYLPSDSSMIEYSPQTNQIKKKKIELSPIQSLIQQSYEGTLDNVTYICIGDSTRARDHYYNGGHIFDQVESALQRYGVNSILQAKPGHTALEYNRAANSPNWRETIYHIPSQGETTIVDISLGINDARYYSANAGSIKYFISQSIDKILNQKPKTTFMLTMPNKLIGMNSLTIEIKKAYEELSRERNILLINTINEIFPSGNDYTLFRAQDAWDYNSYIRIHLSEKGQALVANLILSKILP